MAPHLARSYHHLFPMDSYKETSNELSDVDISDRTSTKQTLYEYFLLRICVVLCTENQK